MTEIKIEVDGKAAFDAHIRRVADALDAAVKRGVTAAVRIYQREIMTNLRRRTHRAGTVTNSPPGEPPSLITGHLMRSNVIHPTRRVTAHVYEGATGPTAVQSRIQEKGGWTGRGHRTYLPPRPYVRPAVRSGGPRAHEAIKREIRAAMRTR